MKQSRTLLRFLCAANHGIGTISLVGLLLLSSAAPRFVAAQSAPTESTTNPYANYARFTPSMAIIIVVLVAALFFMAFFSIYIRHCNDPSALAGSTDGTRPPNGRSRRLQRGLDKAVIETFPTLEYSKVKGLKIGKGALECAVCLCEFEDDETLRLIPKCDHVFHPECIDEWLASHTTCPVCRANLVPQPGEEVYQLPELSTEPGASQNGGDGGVTDLERGRPCEDEVSGSTTVQVEELDVVDLNKTLNRNRTRGSRSTRARRFPRSHSTGHSLSLVQPGDDTERFTLRLPVQVRQQIVKRQLDRAMSMVVLPREESLRRGYRTSVGAGAGAGGDGSNRGLRFSFSRRFDRFSRSVRSDRWGFSVVPPFFTKSSSVRSPRVAADVGEGTSIKPEVVSAGETTRPPV